MKQDKIEHFGKERDKNIFKAIKNTTIILAVIFALIFTATTAHASSTIKYDATRINGQSGTNFNGSQYLRSFNVSINESNGFTAIVWASQSVNTTQATIFKYNTINSDFTGYISFGPTNTDWGMRLACSNCTDTLSSGATTLPNLSTMYMMTFQFNGTHLITYRNNNSEFSDDSALTGAETIGDVYVGALENGATTARANISKVLIYNRTLTSQEVTNEYLLGANSLTNNTYGLTLQWLLNQTITGTMYSNSSNVFDLSYPITSYNLQTPLNNSNIRYSTFTINATLTAFNISNLSIRINNIDYEIRQSALLWLEFDNNSVLGENASVIKDTSSWNRQINITGAVPGNGNVTFDGNGDYLTADGLNIFASPNYYITTQFLFKNKTLQSGSINSGLFNQRVQGTERNGSELLIYFNRTGTRNSGYLPRYLVFNGSNSQMTNNGWGQIFDEQINTIGITFNNTHYTNFLYGAVDSIDAQTFYPNNTNSFEIGTYGSGSTGFSMNGSIYQFIILNRTAQPNEEKNTYKFTKTSSNTYELILTRLIEGNSQINFSIIVNGIESEKRTITANATIPVNISFNFSNAIKTINFSYGTQDSYFSENVAKALNTTMKAMYENMSIDYYRIWVSNADTTSPSTGSWLDMMPVGAAGSCQVYDYTNLTRMLQFTLDAGMIPHIMFVHIPPCWANYTTGLSTMTMMNITYNTDLWGNYTRNVRDYFEAECSSGNLTCTGDQAFSNWIWQIGNEPGGGNINITAGISEGNFSEYTTRVYIPAVNRLREGGKNPIILSGTLQSVSHMTAFFPLLNSSQIPTLASNHLYDDLDIADPDLASFLGINIQDVLRHSTRQGYSEIPNNYMANMRLYSSTIQQYNDEYSMSSDYTPHKVRFVNESVGKTWMASAFYWQIAFSNITKENQFEGLGNDQFGFGIGVIKNSSELSSIRPLYDIRVKFGEKFTTGKNVYVCYSSDPMIECLATQDDIVIINKYNKTTPINISINGATFTDLLNDSGSIITATNSLYPITLQPFEVQFLSMDNSNVFYVNISNPSCSDSYTRSQASNPSTPWCSLSTAETNIHSGENVTIADGVYRNTNGYTFNVKYNSTVTFNFQSNNTIITRSQSNAETIPNTVWTNISNSTYTNRWTYSYSTGSSTVSAEYASTNQPILRCSYQNITLSYASRGFECTYFNTTTSTLILDLAPGVNPRSTSLYVFNGDVITFDNAHNVKFVGGTIRGGWQLIDSSASGQSKNLTFENINFRGGTSDTGAIDVRRIDGFQVLNSTFYRTQLSSWWWYMIKQSNLGGETAAIFCADGCNNTIIANTTIYGYFNGMSLINTTNGSNNGQTNFHNIKIEYNNITDVYDDAIELEGIGNNITIFNNTVYDAFVAISLTPFNNTVNAMIVNYNRLHSVKRINYTKSGSTFTTIQGESFKLLLNNSLVNAVLDHNSMYGDRNIACRASSTQVYTNCMYNVNITNNVMLSENNYVLDASGLNSSKVYYNNNLYFNATGGSFIFRYWNSLTDNNYQTLALAKASANNPGTWDTNSFDQSPLITNFLTGNFTPASNSPLCGTASDGTDIGSEACAAYVYQIIGVNITNPSSLIINGTLNFQVNYTITGTEPLYCDLYVNGVYNNNQSTPSAGDYSVTGSVPTNGTYNYYITCTDQIFATNTTTNYSITMNKVLINATQTQFIPNSNSCIGSNCAGGNNSLAFDGNISTKANYIVGTTSYISQLYSNYTAPSGTIASKLYYFLYCNSDYSGNYDLNNNQYNSGVIALQGYLVDTGFKANYLGVWNGTDYQLIGGTYICGSGGSSTHGYYETYLNNTLFYALNFTNINNSYSLKQRMFNITTNLINNNGLGGAINYTFRVYNSTGNLVDSGMINAVSPNATFQTNLTMNGLYYYNVTAENSTHFAISQLYSVNVYDFAVTINNPTPYQNFNNTLLINWTASFSGNSSTTILGANITIDSILIANMQAMNSTYQWNNTYNYNLSLGYHTLGVNIVDSSGANTNTTVIVNHTYNTLLNITARTALGNGTINQFTGWIYSNQTGENRTFNITNGMGLFNFTRGIVTVYLESINYSIDLNISLVDINITSSQYNLQFYLYETNSLNVTFYDQANPSVLLTGVNITLDLISDSYSNSYSTTNGSMYLPLLQAETYIVRYSAPNYALRFYTVTIDDRTAQSIQLYLVSTNVSQNVTITVQDEVLNPVQAAIVKALKYDLATNTYILQEIGTTDVNGKVIMSLTLNDEYYKFIVEYPSGTVVKITDPAYIISNAFTIVVNFGTDLTSELLQYQTISYSLTFNTLSNNFRLDYTDANNIASQYCLYVYQMNNASQTLYGISCQTGSSGTILVPVENSSGLIYQAKAVYTDNTDSETKFLASLYQEFPWISALATRYGLFLQLLITLAFTALFILNAGVAIIGVAFSLILGKLIGLNAFSWLALIALQVASLIMGIALAMRRT